MSCWWPDRLSGSIFAQFYSILILIVFPCLANPHVIANEVQLLAVTTETSALVVGGHRDALNLYLGHEAIVVITAVGTVLAPCIFLVALHGFSQTNVELFVCARCIGWHLGSVVPILDRNDVVLLVLCVGDEFLIHRQTHEALGHHHKFVHAVSPYVAWVCAVKMPLTNVMLPFAPASVSFAVVIVALIPPAKGFPLDAAVKRPLASTVKLVKV